MLLSSIHKERDEPLGTRARLIRAGRMIPPRRTQDPAGRTPHDPATPHAGSRHAEGEIDTRVPGGRIRLFHMELRGVLVVEDADVPPRASRAGRIAAVEHVANRPIAHHVLDVFESAGVDEIVVASSASQAGEVQECVSAHHAREAIPVRFVQQPGPLDVAAALRLSAPVVEDSPCIVHLASGLLGEPLAAFVERLHEETPDVVAFVHQGPAPDERLSTATQEMLHIAALRPERAAMRMAGVWLFGRRALQSAAPATWKVGGDVDLTAVADRVAGLGGTLCVRLADAWRKYAGDPLDLLELNRIVLDGLETDVRRLENNGNRIEGRVWIHEGASVRGSVIVGPSVIGPGASVADAYIGPYTSVGAGARIEGAEVERSIISAGASVMHIGGRLVTSVVGRDARVFRDFSLPRALRLRVGDGTEVALC